jgi:cytochrome c
MTRFRKSYSMFAVMPGMILGCALLSACGQSGNGEKQGADVPSSASGGDGGAPAVATAAPPPAFAVCSACHAVVPGGRGSGPTLAGVWGRKAGTLPGYTYSAALKSSNIVWNAQTLDTWLEAPMKMVPGTRMVVGVPNAQARKAVIDYLETLK